MKQLFTLMFLLLAFQTVQSAPTENLADLSPAEEERFRELITELRCLVCQNQSLADSNAELALDMRNEVHKKVAAGKSNQEIIDFLVERYGDFVRYRPPIKATTLLLWFGPFLLLGLGAFVLMKNTKKRTSPETLTAEQHAEAQRLLNDSDEDNAS